MTVRAGTYRGYRLGAGGAILGTRTVAIGATSGASVSQRSTLPNLPGRWLFVENGAWDSLWLPESAAVFLPGTVEHDALPTSTRVTFRAGTHTGYRFATDGDVTATRSATLAGASGANTDARAAINGRWYLHIVNGIWAGYWVPESWAASIAGRVDEMSFPGAPRITFATGTYTGYAFDAAGRVTGSRTYRLTAPSGASASGWAVINGRPYFRVANGIWAGYWVQDGESVDLGT
jgi:hypothetical protein